MSTGRWLGSRWPTLRADDRLGEVTLPYVLMAAVVVAEELVDTRRRSMWLVAACTP
jgi:hypothetical protein